MVNYLQTPAQPLFRGNLPWSRGCPFNKRCIVATLEILFGKKKTLFDEITSSETQGQSFGPGEKARRKFSCTGERAPGYRLSPNHFQTVKRMMAPDWAQKMLCIILPNRRKASPEFFLYVCTQRLLSRHTCPPVRSPRLCVQGKLSFSTFPSQNQRNYR